MPATRPFAWFNWFRNGSSELAPPPVRPIASTRKLRLLAVAYCRRVEELLADPRSRAALEVAEQHADGLVGKDVLAAAEADVTPVAALALDASRNLGLDALLPRDHSRHRAVANATLAVLETIRGNTGAVMSFAASAAMDLADNSEDRAWAVQAAGAGAQLGLIRHLFGNPFRHQPALSSLPASVLNLAEALYGGQDCGFAVHDALLESGYPDLASHFQEERGHPKGCWALDQILEKA
jgi:hypothetical protein